MRKLKTWFYVLKRSLFDPSYYRDILNVKFSFSVLYLYGLLFFISLFYMLQFAYWGSFRALPKLPKQISILKTELKKTYPKELTVYVKNGKVSTNVKEPYFLDIPPLKSGLKKESFDHFITIDTHAKVDDYQRYRTLLLITKSSIIHPNERSQSVSDYAVTSLNKIQGSFVINEKLFDDLVAKATPFIDALPSILTFAIVFSIVVAPFAIAGIWLVGKMYFLVIFSIVVFVFAKFMKKELNYSKSYRLSIHGASLPTVVVFLLGLFNLQFAGLYTLVFIGWMIAVIRKIKV